MPRAAFRACKYRRKRRYSGDEHSALMRHSRGSGYSTRSAGLLQQSAMYFRPIYFLPIAGQISSDINVISIRRLGLKRLVYDELLNQGI